jgi:hypothetical protein
LVCRVRCQREQGSSPAQPPFLQCCSVARGARLRRPQPRPNPSRCALRRHRALRLRRLRPAAARVGSGASSSNCDAARLPDTTAAFLLRLRRRCAAGARAVCCDSPAVTLPAPPLAGLAACCVVGEAVAAGDSAAWPRGAVLGEARARGRALRGELGRALRGEPGEALGEWGCGAEARRAAARLQ